MEIEDKVLLVNPIGESAKVMVFHQATQRLFRKDIVQQMKKNIKELANLDLDDIIAQVEEHAIQVESNFIKLISNETSPDEAQRIPVFDFEINWSIYSSLNTPYIHLRI